MLSGAVGALESLAMCEGVVGLGDAGRGEPGTARPRGALRVGPVPLRCALWLLALLPQDTELLDLRETIDFLKKKNSEAQAVIQGALNGTDVTPKGTTQCCSPHHGGAALPELLVQTQPGCSCPRSQGSPRTHGVLTGEGQGPLDSSHCPRDT